MRDNHPIWAKIRASLVQREAQAARDGLPWDTTAHVEDLTSIWVHNRFLAVETLKS